MGRTVYAEHDGARVLAAHAREAVHDALHRAALRLDIHARDVALHMPHFSGQRGAVRGGDGDARTHGIRCSFSQHGQPLSAATTAGQHGERESARGRAGRTRDTVIEPVQCPLPIGHFIKRP